MIVLNDPKTYSVPTFSGPEKPGSGSRKKKQSISGKKFSITPSAPAYFFSIDP
jgi:hypothetical protein